MDRFELEADGLGDWPQAWSGDLYAGLAGVVDLARKIASDFRDRAVELRKSGDLTPSGMAKQLDELAQQELSRLDALAATALGKARRDLEIFTSKLGALNTPPADSAALAIREAETRALLLDLPESDRIAVVSEALATGDTLVLRAVFQAPAFWRARFITPAELLEDMRTRWQQGADPVLAKKVRDLGAAISKTSTAVLAGRLLVSQTEGLSEQGRTSLAQKLGEDPLAAA